MAPAEPEEKAHLLSAASRVWKDVAPELQDGDGVEGGAAGELVSTKELQKVGKWMQHTLTKFGASASVADGADRLRALQPIAEEVVKAFTAAIGTLLSMRKGAGRSLLAEMRQVGQDLAEVLNTLGAVAAVEGNEALALSVGKALERVKHFERVSVQNSSAIRRRLLRNLAQLRDASRELDEVLESTKADEDDEDDLAGLDDDDDLNFDEDLDAEDRKVVEALREAVRALEDTLKQASSACAKLTSAEGPPSLLDLEKAIAYAASANEAVDGMAVAAAGGLDLAMFRPDLEKFARAVDGLAGVVPAASERLQKALPALQAAVEAAAEAQED
eukprot:TRINITY_DN57061_c0_g1_i1.p1 TRINITY_DN57061_c0_g1~~TRINITY_DN57061_c0_g1_i1.p1  ORF type:complete len:351 (-),score=113.32 TRINITY_DN57061_c0_g1_i1:106-1098(-)